MNDSYRLWSLLDMLKLGVNAFGRALNDLGMLRASCLQLIGEGGEKARQAVLLPEFRTIANKSLGSLRSEVITLDAPVTLAAVDRLVRHLQDKDYDHGSFAADCNQIEVCLFDELGSRHVFVLGAKNFRYFDAGEFGPQVATQFPSTAYDIDEAGKCLALGRSTACVFHLMRALEVVLHAVHRCLGNTAPPMGAGRNWGVILNDVKQAIARRGSGFTERDAFQEMYALLDAVKDAWRNSTMHVEDKKTEEEAEVIFLTVRNFMRKAASRMDENGLPLSP